MPNHDRQYKSKTRLGQNMVKWKPGYAGMIAVAVIITPAHGWAHGDKCASEKSPASQILCLQTENAILKLQIENAKAKKDLKQATEPATSAQQTVEKRVLPLPSVLSIYGGTKLTAVLEYRNTDGKIAGSIPVRTGGSIPGGWLVKMITPSTVTVQNGKRTAVLLMSAPAAQNSGSASTLGGGIGGSPFNPGPVFFPHPIFHPIAK